MSCIERHYDDFWLVKLDKIYITDLSVESHIQILVIYSFFWFNNAHLGAYNEVMELMINFMGFCGECKRVLMLRDLHQKIFIFLY